MSGTARTMPAAPPVIRLAMVEDHALTRIGLIDAFTTVADMRLEWAVANRAEALAALPQRPLDVLLVDLGLPDGSGLDVIAAACRHWPGCGVMVSTGFGDEDHVLRAIEAGALGYLLKDRTPLQLVDEVRRLHAGGSPIDPLVARKLLQRQRTAPPAPASDRPALSVRESEVLRRVASGYTLDEVAQAMDLSRHTVRTFVRRIYAKLQVSNRAQAVQRALREGLID